MSDTFWSTSSWVNPVTDHIAVNVTKFVRVLTVYCMFLWSTKGPSRKTQRQTSSIPVTDYFWWTGERGRNWWKFWPWDHQYRIFTCNLPPPPHLPQNMYSWPGFSRLEVPIPPSILYKIFYDLYICTWCIQIVLVSKQWMCQAVCPICQLQVLMLHNYTYQ